MKEHLSKLLQLMNILVILGAGVGFWTNQTISNAVQNEQIKNLSLRLDEFMATVNMRFDKSDQKTDALYLRIMGNH